MSPASSQLHPQTTSCLAPHIGELRAPVIFELTQHLSSVVEIYTTHTKTFGRRFRMSVTEIQPWLLANETFH
jgi:hypothetical protein